MTGKSCQVQRRLHFPKFQWSDKSIPPELVKPVPLWQRRHLLTEGQRLTERLTNIHSTSGLQAPAVSQVPDNTVLTSWLSPAFPACLPLQLLQLLGFLPLSFSFSSQPRYLGYAFSWSSLSSSLPPSSLSALASLTAPCWPCSVNFFLFLP